MAVRLEAAQHPLHVHRELRRGDLEPAQLEPQHRQHLVAREFAQEIVSKYNQEEHQTLPRPNSCREFLHLVQAIGYATVDEV